ncbi:sensor histidine kinase [Jannaschia sp. LMIT008]|uniref:sensor histidine kinase n=1 Tax=Jannaschia maritima TaxID=3032585 RepID=UPI0028117881|nr:HWE histidine kinase domain-containing protein [Jannaschia sp. LMIT008]
MKEQNREADAATFLDRLVAETDWQAIAPAAAGIGRFVYDPRTEMAQMDATMRRLTGMLDRVGAFPAADYFTRIHSDDRDAVGDQLALTVREGTPFHAEYRFERSPGEVVWLSGQGRMTDTSDGRSVLVGALYDITTLRSARERAVLLSEEMAHRMKNVFALVQGMFNMAARSSGTKEELVEAYTGRLQALAQVNAMTFASPDRSVRVTDLVSQTLGPLVAAKRIDAAIDDVAVNGAAAQTVVLVLNELLTNAVKYGALRDDAGSVALSIVVVDGGFTLTWDEHATPPITPPTKKNGFGMRVLNSMTSATFSGRPSFEWRERGLLFSCHWDMPTFGPDPRIGASAVPTGTV